MPWGMVKLLPMDGGSSRACRGITQGQTGFVSRQYNMWTAQTLDDCKALCTGSCTGIEFQASNKYCEVWYGDILFSTKSEGFECYVKQDQDRESKLAMIRPQDDSCLRSEVKGCGALKDRYSCLSSKDGSSTGDIYGLQVTNEPCVWCGGGFCRTGSDNKCEPFDFLLRGMGKEHGFDSFTAVGTFETPTCKAGKPTVFDEAAQMVFGNVQCLKKQPEGCGAIKDRSTCLSSVDGRQFPGLKVENQPCVWCGGAPCNIDNGNLCEPYGFALNEKSGAFHTYFAAACEDGNVVEESISTAMARTGVVTSVDCGIPNPMWLGVSKSCGFCQAQVAEQAAASYRSCTAYCQAQGGLSCAKAFNGFMASCDLGTETTCEAVFEANSHPVCQCQPASVKEREANANFAAALPRPTEEKTVCLDVVAAGCGSLKDKLSCLSSKDGSVADYRGLKIAGEPCVWCGGGACTDHDESVLCAAYDFVANGQGLAFTSRQAITVMDVAHCKEPTENFGNLECLQKVSAGCNSIEDQDTCLASVDGSPYKQIAGLKVEGQPCVWCGGAPCSENGKLCEPHEFVTNGGGHAYDAGTAVYYTAACEAGKPVSHTITSPMANYGQNVAIDCGIPNPIWYKVGKTCGFCKVQVAKMALPVYKNCTGYCHAQGLKCASAAKGHLHSCDVESPMTCDTPFGDETGPLCECQPAQVKAAFKAAPRPTEEQMHCLKAEEKGCFGITDRINCLSSKDGATQVGKAGFKIGGEPCVWCGDGLCSSDSAAKCAPYDWLMNGQGVEYTTNHAIANYDVATCKANPDAVFPNLDCLASKTTGCNSIQDEEMCLKSKDGRPYEYIAGFKASGQPCVWCGGGDCHSSSTNKCEPYDFAVNGEGHAFNTFHAVGTYKMAACEGGSPAVHFLNSGFSEHGTSLQVQCGSGPAPVWAKVSRTCGECTVNVPNIKEFYYTCAGYCKYQPGSPQCVGASIAYHPSSCDIKMGASCDFKFNDEQDAICQCEKVLLPHEKIQALYAQCGGKEWRGFTQCEAGATCNIVDEWYSQCVPILAAKPGVKFTSGEAELAAANAPIGDEEELGAGPALGATAAVAGVTAVGAAAGAAAPVTGAMSPECSAHPKCAELKLTGNCCPNDAAAVLGCCTNFDPTAAVAAVTVAPTSSDVEVGTIAPLATPAPADQSYWKDPMERPTEAELSCLPAEPKGCSSIRDKLMCLSRVDGRTGYKVHGLNVGGEPCVWCGGGACTDFSDAVCEPYDWLIHGTGKANKNSVFKEEDMSCLKKAESGCNNIEDKQECLSSRDARPFQQVAGLKTNNQPCVWCGGVTCHSNNDNMCEPFDFVMNGAGHAFGVNTNALNTYLVPECQYGKLITKHYGSAKYDRGLPKEVSCGDTTTTWNGVSKVCGACDVTIPNINASYGTCEKYCLAQGGRQCASAGLAYTHSCAVQGVDYLLTCNMPFEEGEAARCRCQGGEVPKEEVAKTMTSLPQIPYAQCGGKGWTGQTKCQVGSNCAVVSEWYSQCLPGALSNPDQAAEAASAVAQAAGKDVTTQAAYAGQAASEAAKVAGMPAATQATRAYVGAAGTADEKGITKEEANAAGVQAVKDALADAGVSADDISHMEEQAVKEGKVIVFGEEQNPSSGPYIAAMAAFNGAKDFGKSKQEQCQKAYIAAYKTAKGNGKLGQQATEVAVDVAGQVAAKIGLTNEEKIYCSEMAAKEITKTSGGFSDEVADSMKIAGTAAAVDIGIASTQVDPTVAAVMKDIETEKADALQTPQTSEIMTKCLAAGQAAGAKAPEAAAAEAAAVGKSLGLSAIDTAQVARKCAYEAAINAGMSPVEATAAAEAARSMVPAIVTAPSDGSDIKAGELLHGGEDCWVPCGKSSGLCAYCGLGNACCRTDELNKPKVCQDVAITTWHHVCVKPVHQPSDVDDLTKGMESAVLYTDARAKAEEMAQAAKAEGKSVEEQVTAASEGAIDSMKGANAKVVDEVNAAYKAAQETGISGGMTQPAAEIAAKNAVVNQLQKNGMSNQEAAAITAATSVAVGGVTVVNVNGGSSATASATAKASTAAVPAPAVPTVAPTAAPVTAAPVTAAPTDAVTLAPVATAAPTDVTLAPVATVEPTATVAPVATLAPAETATVAPVATLAPAETATLAPVATLAPAATLEPAATVAPVAGATLAPVAGATLAPLTTVKVDVTLPPVATVAPVSTVAPEALTIATAAPEATIPPVVTVAPAAHVDLSTVAPAAIVTLPPVITNNKVVGSEETGAVVAATGAAAAAVAAVAPKQKHAITAGLQAAELKEDAGSDINVQAEVAAGTAGAYEIGQGSSQDVAEQSAQEVAKILYLRSGQPEEEAIAMAEEAASKAKEEQGGTFVQSGMLERHGFSDCWEPCGKKPGYCSDYCGLGNACCRKTGDIVVPRECQGVYSFYTPHYECVKPTAIYVPGDEKARGQADSTGAVVSGTEETETTPEAEDTGFGTGAYIAVAACIAACCCAGVAGTPCCKWCHGNGPNGNGPNGCCSSSIHAPGRKLSSEMSNSERSGVEWRSGGVPGSSNPERHRGSVPPAVGTGQKLW
ncbi:unnamed protein product [Durusdinium trenchii]|uniref:CBM1 domain-containing protein n=1 Tax=Durusdinium trenchii TaxID=1381693 RepID=A0ABP0NN75_9DINO